MVPFLPVIIQELSDSEVVAAAAHDAPWAGRARGVMPSGFGMALFDLDRTIGCGFGLALATRATLN